MVMARCQKCLGRELQKKNAEVSSDYSGRQKICGCVLENMWNCADTFKKKQLDNFQHGTLAVTLVFLRALVRDRSCSTFDGMLHTTPVMEICQTANRVSSSLWCAHRELLFSIVASQTFFDKTKMLCLFVYDTLVLPLNVTWYTGVPLFINLCQEPMYAKAQQI